MITTDPSTVAPRRPAGPVRHPGPEHVVRAGSMAAWRGRRRRVREQR